MPRPYSAQSAKILAIGFGMTVAMWAVAYVAMMRPGLVVGEMLFVLTLAWLVVGGMVAGRHADSRSQGVRTAAKAGALSAVLNLLIIGSLIGGETTAERLISFALWSGGALAVSIGLCVVGAALPFSILGNRQPAVGNGSSPARPLPNADCRSNWFHRFACVAASAVFLLLITGGLVTGLEAGLAVHDWPNTFGHNMLLYPLTDMVGSGGVYYEHAHRLYGMLVGVTSITLAVALFIYDSRRWLQALGVVVLLMVCFQGLLGGLRVTGHLTFSADPGVMNPNTHLAVVHGVFGQVVFAAVVAIAAFTSSTWISDRPAAVKASAATDRSMSVTLVALLIVQLILGALYRHLRREAGEATAAIEWLYVHILLAFLVTAAAVFVGGRAWAFNSDQPVLPRLGKSMLHVIGLQVLLGVGALMAVLAYGSSEEIHTVEVAITTAHQATGALVLALAVLLALWTRRLLAPP